MNKNSDVKNCKRVASFILRGTFIPAVVDQYYEIIGIQTKYADFESLLYHF